MAQNMSHFGSFYGRARHLGEGQETLKKGRQMNAIKERPFGFARPCAVVSATLFDHVRSSVRL